MQKSKKVVVFGTGRFAEYVSYLLINDSKYSVDAFCVGEEYLNGRKEVYGLPLVSFQKIASIYPPDKYRLFIAIGKNKVRSNLYNMAKTCGYSLISYVSSKAIIWKNLSFGENCWIGEGSVIQPFVTIGDNSILFGARVGHHSKIDNHTLLSGTTIGGNVSIGELSMLSLNSCVKQNLIIGKNNIVGMGSIIGKNTKDNEVYHCLSKKRNISSEKFIDRCLNVNF